MDDEVETYNLWRIRKTVMQMCHDRGYLVTQDELDQTLDQFKEQFGDRPRYICTCSRALKSHSLGVSVTPRRPAHLTLEFLQSVYQLYRVSLLSCLTNNTHFYSFYLVFMVNLTPSTSQTLRSIRHSISHLCINQSTYTNFFVFLQQRAASFSSRAVHSSRPQ